jgi:hypothetical protein
VRGVVMSNKPNVPPERRRLDPADEKATATVDHLAPSVAG